MKRSRSAAGPTECRRREVWIRHASRSWSPSGRVDLRGARPHRRLRNRLNDAVEGLGLSYAQVEILLMLEERTNLQCGQIALELGLSRQAVHGVVRKLEGGSLVDVLGYDGTARPIALTDLGRRRLTMAWKVLSETVHPALWRMPAPERRSALEAMQRCERALAQLRPPWWLD